MSDTLVNRVTESGLITLRPEEWIPKDDVMDFDLKPFLFQGLILREQDFRDQINKYDWNPYKDKVVCVHCSADAIIPSWAFMLVTARLAPLAKNVFYGTEVQWTSGQMLRVIDQINAETYRDQRVIIKGCSNGVVIGPEVFIALSAKLVPVVKSLMFGEPCSTVPVYKRPKGA